jgi:3-vinyl bacteriochlorophyllide hydratase
VATPTIHAEPKPMHRTDRAPRSPVAVGEPAGAFVVAAMPGGLYTPEERKRRDASKWTLVQGILAPLQFLVMVVSVALVVRFLATGDGYLAATVSVVVKTLALYAIMVTGSLWEKDVFGRYLFAPLFFWEDVVSMGVLALHTAYLVGLFTGWMGAEALMWLALAAYAAYGVNAGQFVLKLRAARRGGVRVERDGWAAEAVA